MTGKALQKCQVFWKQHKGKKIFNVQNLVAMVRCSQTFGHIVYFTNKHIKNKFSILANI